MTGYREKGARLFLQMHRTLGNIATQEIPITRQNYFNHEASQVSGVLTGCGVSISLPHSEQEGELDALWIFPPT